MDRPRLLLVDGNSLANRAFYALPSLSTNQGVHTGAVFGFLTMLFRFIQEKRPTHIAVAFDHPSPTFRHAEYSEYKKTRKPSPVEFKAQIPVLKEVLDTLNLPFVELAGYEADDIIGTMASQAGKEGFRVVILSGDRDCLQLVDDNIEAILPVRGITQVKEYVPESVKSDLCLDPCQVIEYKALAGDSSDNIPGVKGIGDKTALGLLAKYRDLEDIYSHLDEITPPRTQNLLRNGRDQAFFSRGLATIKRDVPLDVQTEGFRWMGPSGDRARAKFTELEFYTLISRLGSVHPATEEAGRKPEGDPQEPWGRAPVEFRLVQTTEALDELVRAVLRSGRMSVYADASAVTKDFRWPTVIGVATGDPIVSYLVKAPEPRSVVWSSPEAWQETLWGHFQPLLVNPEIEKTGFDLKWLFTLCFKRGVNLDGSYFDALVASYLLDPTRTAYRLSEIARKYGIDVPFLPDKGEKESMAEEADRATGEHYALGAASCFAVAEGLGHELRDGGLLPLADEVELPLIQVLAAMEAVGVGVDLELGRSIRKEFTTALSALEADIYEVAGEEFNLGSPKQLAHILFEKLGLKPVKKTKTGYSTDAEVLEILSLEHELPQRIVEYRQYAKLKSTYLDVLENVINPTTGRIHSTFHQTVTATGRLSSSEPNLQNIPVRGELGRSLRRIFIPAQGRLFMAADYSQIELRVMAHMAGDPSMIDAFRKGEDIHTRTASEMFGVPFDQVDSDLRSQAKAVNFGVIYGISDFGLARNTGVSREDARKFIDAYFSRYPKVREYMDASIERARETGYATTILGRRRAIPDIDARIRQKRGFAERTAMNTPIQGSAADIIKLAMVRIYRRLKDEELISRLILQVHDELIFEVPPSEEEYMRELVTREMEHVMELDVPLKVDLDVGKSWYDV